jgi:nicotinamide-nucleotide amidase
VTREAIAAAVGKPLQTVEAEKRRIEEFFASRGYPMAETNLKQAQVPAGGELIANPRGTAPGVFVEHEGSVVLAVPGVPREMQAMIAQCVLPRLRALMPENTVIRSRTLRLAGIGESSMAKKVEDILTEQANPTVAPLVGRGDVLLRITAKGNSVPEVERSIAEVEARLRERVGEYVYATGDEPLEHWLVHALVERGLTIAIAESCTGGLISDRITNVSGSSGCFLGSVVSYSNEAKASVLQVQPSLIEAHGAVSVEVAEAMAIGVRELCESDFGLSATGIAGPTGARPGKPVGLVYTALSSPDGVTCTRNEFTRDRLDNKQRASQAALLMLLNHLEVRA